MKNNENPESLFILYLISKVFYKCNRLQLCPYFVTDNHLDPWVEYFKTLLDMAVPENLATRTEDTNTVTQMEKTVFWKIKAIAAKITFRIFAEYSDPSKTKNELCSK